jgi:hypothetical protein
MSTLAPGNRWSVADQLERIEFDLLRAVAALDALYRPTDGPGIPSGVLASEGLRTIGREIETAATALGQLRAELSGRRVG